MYLGYQELLLTFSDRKLNAKEERLFEAFSMIDTDGNGSISIDELTRVLIDHNVNMSQEDIQSMLNEVDTNHDGTIDYQEFIAVLSLQNWLVI